MGKFRLAVSDSTNMRKIEDSYAGCKMKSGATLNSFVIEVVAVSNGIKRP